MIKFKFAYNSLGKIVNIDEIEKGSTGEKERYKCISCDKEFIARLGEENQHHFAHKIVDCNFETYLHKLGKILFEQEYKKCLKERKPFSIELYQKQICNKCESLLNKVCDLGEELLQVDLTKHFDKIEVEKREGEFIPDIKLSGQNTIKKIFVEIAVTHLSSKEKISSGKEIIELKVDDLNDLDVIRTNLLSVKNPKILLRNFVIRDLRKSFYADYCDKKFDLFLVFNDGKCGLISETLNQIGITLKEEKENLLYFHISLSSINNSNIYKYIVARAFTKNIKVKNCFLCINHNQRISANFVDSIYSKEPVICKHYKNIRNSGDAIKCNYYRTNHRLGKSLFDSFGSIVNPKDINGEEQVRFTLLENIY